MKRVSPKDAFVGESLPDGGEGADEAVIMAVRGGELVAAFAAAGWSWGGVWANPDYQHFSSTGN